MSLSLGENIKKYRKSSKMSQNSLGELIGKSLRMIQKYESGEVIPSLDVIEEISKALNIPESELLSYENSPYVQPGFSFELNDIINEKVFEIVEHLVIEREIDKTLNLTPIEIYKKDKHTNKLILKSIGSIIDHYLETLKNRIVENSKDLNPIKEDILINFPIGKPSEIQGTYKLGYKDESIDYVKYQIIKTFNKFLEVKFSSLDYSLDPEEIKIEVEETNKEIEKLIDELSSQFLHKYDDIALEHPEIDINLPDLFRDPGKQERIFDIMKEIIVNGANPPSKYLESIINDFYKHFSEDELPKFIKDLLKA